MNWRLAESLVQMRSELMLTYPNRDRESDGSIGDENHATRTSDHNPWVHDKNGQPVVTAIDVDREIDPPRFLSRDLAEFLRLRRDARIKYVISNGQMFASYSNATRKAWEWGSYTGPNGHFHHTHISVLPEQRLYDSKSMWGIASTRTTEVLMTQRAAPPVQIIVPDISGPQPIAAADGGMPVLMMGSAGPDVGYLQRMLGIKDDKSFGPATRDAVKAFQRRVGHDDSGVVDAATWIMLRA